MPQNTSHAVMNQRTEPAESLDDFPTKPWAVRGMVEHILKPRYQPKDGLTLACQSVLEPACGRGHMSEVLREYFGKVTSYDIADYGYARALRTRDFRTSWGQRDSYDWVITNPPFNQAYAFIDKGLLMARVGVAMLVRSNYSETITRYEDIFSSRAPTLIAQYVERVPLHKGRLLRKGSTATAYCWMIWLHGRIKKAESKYLWIPPCRTELERDEDYSDDFVRTARRRPRA